MVTAARDNPEDHSCQDHIYVSAAVSPAGGAVESRSRSTGCCSGVGEHSEKVAAGAQGSCSRAPAALGDEESE